MTLPWNVWLPSDSTWNDDVGALPDAADFALVDLGQQVHRPDVGDGEERRRLEGRGNGLSDVHRPVDHDAVDRRAHDGPFEIDFRLFDRGLARS